MCTNKKLKLLDLNLAPKALCITLYDKSLQKMEILGKTYYLRYL